MKSLLILIINWILLLILSMNVNEVIMLYLIIITYIVSIIILPLTDNIFKNLIRAGNEMQDFLSRTLENLIIISLFNVLLSMFDFVYHIIYINPSTAKGFLDWVIQLDHKLGILPTLIIFALSLAFLGFIPSYFINSLPMSLFQSIKEDESSGSYITRLMFPFIVLFTVNFSDFYIFYLIFQGIVIDRLVLMVLLSKILLFLIIMLVITYSASIIMHSFGFENVNILKSILVFLIIINIVYLISPITLLFNVITIPISLMSVLLAYIVSPLLLKKNLGKAYLSYIIILIVIMLSNLLLIMVGGIIE
ncbi:hypothetical protein D1869_04880 [Sulfurisphaera ohwakuensis]|uniref:Uncharacterized protein n=1 Tax=Sulfurisphaera ohwakuensis TaxID=69656 RepID=A0A650CFH5_SULOH|nr:hypothetical protein [Sulfurisphaera ohwakuensis]QGR16600.1 hypothetical protein D1869_04880 [Sulfurisphaera ohwakuensis]